VNQKGLGRAESKCWLGKRHIVRVVVINLVRPSLLGPGRESPIW